MALHISAVLLKLNLSCEYTENVYVIQLKDRYARHGFAFSL